MSGKSKTQKLSLRLLRDDSMPEDSVRKGVKLRGWSTIEGSQITTGTMQGNDAPKWADFLCLENDEKKQLRNSTTYAIVFIPVDDRWFAVSFGLGHVKLDPNKFEQNFGLRTVLNTVDPDKIKSMDIRTPDDNTLLRRSQTSRGSDQTAFNIDTNYEILYRLAGTLEYADFGSYIAGKDSLTLHRKAVVSDLPQICSEAYDYFKRDDYRKNFLWIDQILHVRDNELIKELDTYLTGAINEAINDSEMGNLHLAFPDIYHPETERSIRYRGFRCNKIYPDLDASEYIEALRDQNITHYPLKYLTSHTVHEVGEDGKDCGNKWKIKDCISFEKVHDKRTFVLSGGVWYEIEANLAEEVQNFFDELERRKLPPANAGENEKGYNKRVAGIDNGGLLCLDGKLIKPTDATSHIEVCDLISRSKEFIHVKNKNSSSRLSHLFNQGLVSAHVLIQDDNSRDMVRKKIREVEEETRQTGYESILPDLSEDFRPAEFTVVYAVISTRSKRTLPFFSLLSLRAAVRNLKMLGYKCKFSWVERP